MSPREAVELLGHLVPSLVHRMLVDVHGAHVITSPVSWVRQRRDSGAWIEAEVLGRRSALGLALSEMRGDTMDFDRITAEPDKLEGRPTIRGLRITVETVVRLVAAGWSFDDIVSDYPDLERADIKQALEYAAASTNVHYYRLRETA
ncbi:DUF433 domain-containing protein [Microbispora sp. H10670]|nr:DUF433 domain-containing protein [Microbispora sp. H10670]